MMSEIALLASTVSMSYFSAKLAAPASPMPSVLNLQSVAYLRLGQNHVDGIY
jgi:hypothetical protein